MIYSLALLVAGFCEVLGVAALNQMAKSKSITKIFYFISFVIAFGGSIFLLGFAMNEFSMSVAYAVWTGIGAVAVGVVFNSEKFTIPKAVYLFLIIFSVIMLKFI
ncbi:MAG: SMR family transporter [Campylobacter sp.]|nr:SMR family transporter [Campylobacter sp.]